MTRSFLAHLLFSAAISALMSSLVCGIVTYRMVGASGAFMHVWSGAWFFAWPLAFLVIASLGPLVRKTVYRGCNCPMAIPVEDDQRAP